MPRLSHRTNDAIRNILRLRHAETGADPTLREELASVREFLESLVGPTVGRAEAARLLGITWAALDRWIARGEISSVLTPAGRREIPLAELVGLIDEVEHAREANPGRPLARVMRDRQRRAAEAIDLDRLLPRRRRRGHRTAELQSLAYHRLIAERLDEEMVDQARRRLNRWRQAERIHPQWADEWERILAMPLSRVRSAIGADNPRARELRQTSPFAGALTEHERRLLQEKVSERASA